MAPTRSAVFTMLQNDAHLDRRVDSFPKPFRTDATPYLEEDFSVVTKNACALGKSPCLHISKAIFLGDVAVGKTSLVNRFCHQIFDNNYKATIGVDFEVERFDVLSVPFNLQIWDTAGQERFKCIAQAYYRNAHIIVVVFDLSNSATITSCTSWLSDALKLNYSDPLVFLVGTKKDALSPAALSVMERRAMNLAKEIHAEFWAVSSRTGENVKELFHRMAALAFEVSIDRYLQPSTPVELGKDVLSLSKSNSNERRFKSKCSSCLQ